MSCPQTIKEFNVSVPWGHVAVKTWGDEKNEAIIVTHGRLDNAGSFDRLIPYLPNCFYYICVDLPGHGKSSHFPAHLPIHSVNYVIVYKLLAQYFKQENYTIIGHSYGGQIGFLFAQLYPNYVKSLVLLDTVHLYPIEVKEFKYFLIESIDNSIKLMEKEKTGKAPTYTYEEAFEKVVNNRNGMPLLTEAATALFQRGVEPTGDGRYRFTFDQRMKSYINPVHDFRYILETLKIDPVTCPVLIILGEQSVTKEHMTPLLREFETWTNVSIKYVDGFHDFHNNTPNLAAPLIYKFLLSQKAKL